MKLFFKEILTGLLILYCLRGRAQSELIGRSIPDFEFTHVLNEEDGRLKLSDYRGKLLILDFWSHGCRSCIADIPELNSLQKMYKDKVQMIMVNKESSEATLQFFSNRPKITRPEVPMITGDSILFNFIRVDYYPLHIWVDAEGFIQYVTNGSNTAAEHLDEYFSGARNKLKTVTKQTASGQPLFAYANPDWKNTVPYFSYLAPCPDTIGIGGGTDSSLEKLGRFRYSQNCKSIIDLYLAAFQQGGKYRFHSRGAIQIDIPDSLYLFRAAKRSGFINWKSEHTYSYDLVIPNSQKSRLFQFLQEDLFRHFGFSASVRKIKKDVYVLVKAKKKWTDQEGQKMFEHEFSLTGILQSNISRYCGFYFSDEIKLPSEVQIRQITFSNLQKGDLSELRKDLRVYGFDIIQQKRWVDVLVIDKK